MQQTRIVKIAPVGTPKLELLTITHFASNATLNAQPAR